MTALERIIDQQSGILSRHLEAPMAELARDCALVWSDADALDALLEQGLATMPICQLLYAVDTNGVQASANISASSIDATRRGQDLSARPFLSRAVPCRGFLLSEVYISQITGRPCTTAVQAVSNGHDMLGFIAADFNLRDLPLLDQRAAGRTDWRQIKGDPTIRSALFQQSRAVSAMDEHIDNVIAIMDELICERGVFHVKLHFSSSRATLWLTDDPYNYRLHVLDEIIAPSVCLAYPQRSFPQQATVPQEWVRPIFERFKTLREADENVYLRAGSLNIINGMVGLNFSCDGSHYIHAGEFLHNDQAFWFAPQETVTD
jgi:hypothetical protein